MRIRPTLRGRRDREVEVADWLELTGGQKAADGVLKGQWTVTNRVFAEMETL